MRARRIAVAYSGGRDSTALLHATVAAAADLDVEVFALHVHHGLSAAADAWLAHCEAQCRRWSRGARRVSFDARRLRGAPGPGDSVEAWARTARYAALGEMARSHGVDRVLLAHHRRDQAETLLLQSLRGAGVAGQSAMPRRLERDGIVWCRPWLDRPHAQIEAYVRRHRLAHVDDDTNADPRFDRNRLRSQVWPALVAAFPQAESTLAAAAERAQQAAAALDELAALDLAQVATAQGLQRSAWLGLSAPRRANALRAWLRRELDDVVPATLLTRLLDELPRCSAARWPCRGGELRLYRGVLRSSPMRPLKAVDAAREDRLTVRRAGRYALPGWGGSLHVKRVGEGEGGVALASLSDLVLRERSGAERFQFGPGRPPRSLKKQYQLAGVPEWERAGPLVYAGDRLVFVPGLGIDARMRGAPGEALVGLAWRAAATPAAGRTQSGRS